jgi:DNA-binding SARP family transcriptional activator/ABC-type branched-subunit amino acid transport system substrate-binding protein
MRYEILGSLEVIDRAGTVPVPHGRARLLLAVLLVNADAPVSNDRLIEALWGDAPPPTAARSLHNLVSGLRKSLGDGRLLTHPRGGYQLTLDGDELDAARFDMLSAEGRDALTAGDARRGSQLLRDALALWRGPAFGELTYEDALEAEVARLEELRLVTLEDRIEADLALGRHAALVAELEGAVLQHPLRERLRGQLILALYRSGRQADALRAYADARRYLVDELGLEPSPPLRDLERAVLEHDPALDPPRGPPLTRHTTGRRHVWLAAAGALLIAVAVAVVLAVRPSDRSNTGAAAHAGGDMLAGIDTGTGKLATEVTVGDGPTSVAVGGGAVWAVNAADRTLSRVDLKTDTARTFSTDLNVVDIAAGGDGVWLAQSAPVTPGRIFWSAYAVPSQATNVDPLTGVARETTKLPVPKQSSTFVSPAGVIATADGITWVISRPGWIHRIDTRTGRRTTLRQYNADAIAAGDGQVWAYEKHDLVRLDPATGREWARVNLAAQWVDSLAVGAGAVWATDAFSGVIWRVDPRTLTARTIDVGRGVDTVAFGDRAVWAASSELGRVYRIDPAHNRVTATVKVPGTPRGLAVGGGRAWVSLAGVGQALPAAGGLKAGAHVTALAGPPCSDVLTGEGGDPDLLIASDLPLGAPRATTLSMADAVAFVLRRRNFRAGRFTLGLQTCDDSSADTGEETELSCRQNAKVFASNPKLIGVVGPWTSFCAQQMLPILGRAPGGPPTFVAPGDSNPDLVRGDPASPDDGLHSLYPTGQRGYAQMWPADDYVVAAGAMIAKRHGNGGAFFIEGQYDAFGQGWIWFRRAARRIGLRIAGHGIWNVKGATRARALAERVRDSGAGAVYVNSSTGQRFPEVLHELRRLDPGVEIIGSIGFLPVSVLFASAGQDARGMLITSYGLLPSALGPAGRRFVQDFGAARPGHTVTNVDVYSAASTEVLLDAIAHSDGTREGVARALKRTRLDDGVIGPVALQSDGELTSEPVTYVRAERGGGAQDVMLNVEGADVVGVIDVPKRLVGPDGDAAP